MNLWISFPLKGPYYPGFYGALPTRSSYCSFSVSFMAFSSFSSPRFILGPLLFSPTTLSFYTLIYCHDLQLLRSCKCNLNFLTAVQTWISNCLPCPLGALQPNLCKQTPSSFLWPGFSICVLCIVLFPQDFCLLIHPSYRPQSRFGFSFPISVAFQIKPITRTC